MSNYKITPFVGGEVMFANETAPPLFKVDITTRESIVFFDSTVYPCYVINIQKDQFGDNLKKALLKSGLTGFSFPGNQGAIFEFSDKAKNTFPAEMLTGFPDWEWIVFSSDPENDIYINEYGEIICNDKFLRILRSQTLREKRTKIEEIVAPNKNKNLKDDNNISIYKEDKSFNLTAFLILMIIAFLVCFVLFF